MGHFRKLDLRDEIDKTAIVYDVIAAAADDMGPVWMDFSATTKDVAS